MALAYLVFCNVSGKALAAGKMNEKQPEEPAAGALPLTNLALFS